MAYYDTDRGGPVHAIGGIVLAAVLGGAAFFGARYGTGTLCDGVCSPLQDLRDLSEVSFDILGREVCAAQILGGVLAFLLLLGMMRAPRRYGQGLVLLLAIALLGALYGKAPKDGLIAAFRDDLASTFRLFPSAADRPAATTSAPPVAKTEPEPEPPRPAIADDPLAAPTVPDPTDEMDPLADPLADTLADPSPDPIPDTDQAGTAAPAADVLVCGAGEFGAEGACLPCTVRETVRATAALGLETVRVSAAWQYAADNAVIGLGARSDLEGPAPLQDIDLGPALSSLCLADAVLVLGSASADGPLERNELRAIRRARALADQVTRDCPAQDNVFAISLGQSRAAYDADEDRAITVLEIDAASGGVSDHRLIGRELGHWLYEGQGASPLLERYTNFPQGAWVWVRGANGAVRPQIEARPMVEMELPHPDAPVTCG